MIKFPGGGFSGEKLSANVKKEFVVSPTKAVETLSLHLYCISSNSHRLHDFCFIEKLVHGLTNKDIQCTNSIIPFSHRIFE